MKHAVHCPPWSPVYPSVHLPPGGDFITTAYIKYEAGPRHQSTVSTRFNLPELDRRIEANDDSILPPVQSHSTNDGVQPAESREQEE